MATQYRESRNFETSIIDFIEEKLQIAGWTNINVEKTFARVYKIKLDPELKNAILLIRLSDTTWPSAEIGSNSKIRNPLILIDVFATSDGQRLDLKDFLISVLKLGMPYYEYTIVDGTVQSKIQNGRIRVINIGDSGVNLGIEKDKLNVKDRYRHLITLSINRGKIE